MPIGSKPDLYKNWDRRNPDELDYLRPNGFRFLIHTLPKVTYFVQSANIPEISLGSAQQATPFVDIPRPGEKLTFNELTIRFMIQEDLANYTELYSWLMALGFPTSRRQFAALQGGVQLTNADVKVGEGFSEYSDATLLILGSDNKPVAQILFYDCFPISLSGTEFDISSGRTEYFQASATFKYRQYVIESIDNSN